MLAAPGQVWASTDPRDVANGWRQVRVCTRVDAFAGIAYLRTLFDGEPRSNAKGNKMASTGTINRHRYLRPATLDERQAVGLN